MKTMRELALEKKAQAEKIAADKMAGKKQKEPVPGIAVGVPAQTLFHAFHDSSTRQRWHLKKIVDDKIPVDIALNDGTIIRNANLVGHDPHSLILQDGEYRVVLFKHAVASLRFKFSESESDDSAK